jgi:hypothetical protein
VASDRELVPGWRAAPAPSGLPGSVAGAEIGHEHQEAGSDLGRQDHARSGGPEAAQKAGRAEAEAWSVRMEGYGGPAQPSPTIGQCLNGGLSWLEVECNRCKSRASIPLDCIRRPRDTPIWKLEASLKCRSCRKGRTAPPVHLFKLTEQRTVTPYKWVHPSEEDR